MKSISKRLKREKNKVQDTPYEVKEAIALVKSTTSAKGFFRLFNLQKHVMNPIGDPSVLPIQYPIYLRSQAAA